MTTISDRAREMQWNRAHAVLGRAALMRLPEGGWKYGPIMQRLSMTAEALRLPSERGLRIRIATGFSIVIILTLAIAGWSYYNISTLGSAAENLYVANYRSIQYAQEMEHSLSSMELLRAARADAASTPVWRECDATFRAAIEKENHNITEVGESEIAHSVATGYANYLAASEGTKAQSASVLLASIQSLRTINEQAMSRDAAAVQDTSHFARLSSLLITILLASVAIFLSISVSRRSFREFVELDRAKSNFVATAAHELKNPLASIKTSAGMMLDGIVGPVTNKQAEMLATIRDEATRVLELVRELLDLARLEAGTLQLLKQSISIETLLESAIVPISMQAARNDVTIELRLSEGLPQLEVDPNKVSWAITNLLSNAIRYSPKASHVVLSAEEVEDGIRIGVADQGKGIKPEDMTRIFDKFVQVQDSTMGGSIGSGLGLSIAREIVQAHHGRIWVESHLDRGSTFYILLPHKRDTNHG